MESGPKNWKNVLSSPKFIFLAVFILTFSIFLLTRTAQYTTDGVQLARDCENENTESFALLNPQHPFWGLTGRGLYKLAHLAGINTYSIYLIQSANSLFAALCIAFFFLILFKITGNKIISLLFALIPAFTYRFWYYSVEVKMYAISVFFVILALYLVINADRKKFYLFPIAGIPAAFAVFYHVINVLFIPVIIVFALFTRPDLKTRLTGTLSLILVAATLLAVVNTSIFTYCYGNTRFEYFLKPENIYRWFGMGNRFRAQEVPTQEENLQIFTDKFMTLGTGSENDLGDEASYRIFAVKISQYLFPAFLVFCLLLIFAGAWKAPRENLKFILPVLFWITVYSIAIEQIHSRNDLIFIVIFPIVILSALSLAALKNKIIPLSIISLFIIGFFYFNLSLRIYPEHKVSNNPWLSQALALSSYVSRGDSIYYLGFYPDNYYADYFLKVKAVPLDFEFEQRTGDSSEKILQDFSDKMKEDLIKGKKVFIERKLLRPPFDLPSWKPEAMNQEEIKEYFKEKLVFKSKRGIGPNEELFELSAVRQ